MGTRENLRGCRAILYFTSLCPDLHRKLTHQMGGIEEVLVEATGPGESHREQSKWDQGEELVNAV